MVTELKYIYRVRKKKYYRTVRLDWLRVRAPDLKVTAARLVPLSDIDFFITQ